MLIYKESADDLWRHWLLKREVVNDKGNIQWMFPVNSEVGSTDTDHQLIPMCLFLVQDSAVEIFVEQGHCLVELFRCVGLRVLEQVFLSHGLILMDT